MANGVAKADPFEASASAIGYVYQFRKALHCAVERYGRDLDWCVAIEAGDDIEETVKDGKVYYQLKHRAQGTKLTDYSEDLWKTLRIWAKAVSSRQIVLEETDLLLLTTAELVPASAPAYLQQSASGARDVDKALGALQKAVQTSNSRANDKAYQAFSSLGAVDQRRLLDRVQVIGDAPDIDTVKGLLLQRSVVAVGHRHAESFLQRLEGWFFQRAIQQLRSTGADTVTGDEFDQIFTDLQSQFRPENLPIDDDIAELRPDSSDHFDKRFVQQLKLIELGENRIGIAVRDYIRAFTQRSRWLDENLLLPGEIGRYERRLIEAWEDVFGEMEENLGTHATEVEKVAAAKEIYRWAQQATYRIRRDCDEPFVSKGSFHMLADDRKVGWHIDFVARLMAILEPAGAAPS